MNRMTKWNGKKYILPQGYGVWRKIAERLAAYENTGLEPEDIMAMKAIIRRSETNDKEQKGCVRCDILP